MRENKNKFSFTKTIPETFKEAKIYYGEKLKKMENLQKKLTKKDDSLFLSDEEIAGNSEDELAREEEKNMLHELDQKEKEMAGKTIPEEEDDEKFNEEMKGEKKKFNKEYEGKI
jgi:hypothetical protein